MPQLYNAAVITDAGITLLSRAQAGEVSIQFTRMAAGNGIYTDEEKALSALQGSTQLKSEKNSYPISSVGIASDNSVKLTAIITNQDPVTGEVLVDDGYYINEMGLYAKEKDGEDSTEVLYSIVTVASGNGDYMPPYNGYSPAQIVQEYHATVSNAAEVTVRCSGAALLAEDAERRFSAIEEDVARLGDEVIQSWGTGNTVGNKSSIAVGEKNTITPNIAGSVAIGWGNILSKHYTLAVGQSNNVGVVGAAAFGEQNTPGSNGFYSMAVGIENTPDALYASTLGMNLTQKTYGGTACGRWNVVREQVSNDIEAHGDALVVGNGTSDARSNAFRVSHSGDVYMLRAAQSSGADYAEFIKPWADDNSDNEDRVGYFVTIRDGLLYKADTGDYIAGITSGNPSVIGNADEDYYWKYERDAFGRIVLEDVPEYAHVLDDEGVPMFDENGAPVMEATGRMVKRMKLAEDYDKTLQGTYVARRDRPEWDYVGMLGVLPVRDDGTCVSGSFCRCADGGIATLATERSLDTYMVIERITDNVVRVILR